LAAVGGIFVKRQSDELALADRKVQQGLNELKQSGQKLISQQRDIQDLTQRILRTTAGGDSFPESFST
jgi:hypothetical protein